MAYYRSIGQMPKKRHTQMRSPEGELYFEELMGEEGFVSDSSLLYHKYIPSTLVETRPWEMNDQTLRPNDPLLPRHFKTHELFTDADGKVGVGVDPIRGRRVLVGNNDVRLTYVAAREPSPLYRSAVGDDLTYIESGSARLESVFGSIDCVEGDYVVVPRATTHRWVPTGDAEVRMFVVEATSHIQPGRKYLSRFGQLLEHSPFCERDFKVVENLTQEEGENVDVYVKHHGPNGITGTVHVMKNHPFDVVGWDGCLYPWAFNIYDFEPLTGRVHQPPPTHQTFEGNNFVMCNFVPRKVDYHEGAIPVPYYHSNVDSDEIMFYCGGDYEARKGSGIGQGSISLHPHGHIHGPQPGAYEKSIGKEFFDELAVMVDTFAPLQLGEAGIAAEDQNYAWSWNKNAI